MRSRDLASTLIACGLAAGAPLVMQAAGQESPGGEPEGYYTEAQPSTTITRR